MDEASKTQRIRGKEFEQRYFTGKVIDVGSGKDLVVPHAEPFDKQQGDANEILNYRTAASFDCVHSAHCLEHMHQPPYALAGWWGLVKPGGHLIVVVPHEDLYEQGIWPSLFNADHKATFRLEKPESWSPVSHDLAAMAKALPGAELVSAEIHDVYYDHSLKVHGFDRARYAEYKHSSKVRRILRSLGLVRSPFWYQYQKRLGAKGIPVDQTMGIAMAQIQIIVKKK